MVATLDSLLEIAAEIDEKVESAVREARLLNSWACVELFVELGLLNDCDNVEAGDVLVDRGLLDGSVPTVGAKEAMIKLINKAQSRILDILKKMFRLG